MFRRYFVWCDGISRKIMSFLGTVSHDCSWLLLVCLGRHQCASFLPSSLTQRRAFPTHSWITCCLTCTVMYGWCISHGELRKTTIFLKFLPLLIPPIEALALGRRYESESQVPLLAARPYAVLWHSNFLPWWKELSERQLAPPNVSINMEMKNVCSCMSWLAARPKMYCWNITMSLSNFQLLCHGNVNLFSL